MADSYSDSKFGTLRVTGMGVPNVNQASGPVAAMTVDRTAQLIGVDAVVLVQGTGAAHTLRVRVGTSTAGTISVTTNAALAVASLAFTTEAIAALSSGSVLSISHITSEATGVVAVQARWRERFV